MAMESLSFDVNLVIRNGGSRSVNRAELRVPALSQMDSQLKETITAVPQALIQIEPASLAEIRVINQFMRKKQFYEVHQRISSEITKIMQFL
ncbi:hypothetical protein CEXT_191681 [Caerostris extrusa]|uniref:Uncharacterized protein n=1 Tax=Caerostris extrusa TaxID=172846 RepID=A0AAV4R9D4_CAEEX|nr:hypothetical protein CEXT_191681 [Caerostris extrusa]